MTDKVKLIIEIDPNIIYAIRHNKGVTLGNQIDMCNAIKNGKPLSEVTRDIEQEIYDLKEKCTACEYLGCGIIEIIDKHIGKAESEDK